MVWSQFTELSKLKKNLIDLLGIYLIGQFKKYWTNISWRVIVSKLQVFFQQIWKNTSSKPENT